MKIFKKILKFSVLTVALLLIVLPYALKYGATHYLETEKNIQTNIGDVSLNFFSGKFSLEEVYLYGAELGELHLGEFLVDVSMLELFKKNILIESIQLHNLKSNVTELDAAWNVGGIHIPLTSEAPIEEVEEPQEGAKPFDWGYGIRAINFSNIEIDVASQYTDSQFALNKFKFSNALSWFPDSESGLALDLTLNGKSFRVDGDVIPFTNEPVIKTKIVIDDVQLKPFLKSIKDLPFDETSVAVYSDFDLEVVLKKEQLQVGLNGSYGLKGVHLKDKSREINVDNLFWDGAQKITLPKQGIKVIDLDGLFAIENIDVVDADNKVHLLQKKIELAGEYEIKLDDKSDKPDVSALAALTIEALDISSLDGNSKLLSFDNWAVKKINVKGIDNVEVATSELNNLILLNDINNKKSVPVATLDKFIVSDVNYQSNKVSISKIDFNNLNADVRLDKNGNIPALASFTSEENLESNVDAGSKEGEKLDEAPVKSKHPEDVVDEEKRIHIALKEITLNSNSNIRFVDNSVTPVFDTKLHDLKLLVTDVDTSNVKQPIKIDLKTNIDEYAKLDVGGNLRPFSEKLNAKILANLEALELVPLSSYAGKFAGINIKRGTLDVKADVKIKDDILDVNNTFYMNKLIVESDESEVSDNVFKDMPMPLDLTLDVLRDKNNMIKLDIPVKGDVNNPDFSLQDIYNTAMVKAMKYAATHYLMQAVQPLGLIMTATDLAKKAMAPKFDPLNFEVGSAQVSEENKKHIKKLAKILQEKDKLRFTICGNATESDWVFIQAEKAKSGNEGAKPGVKSEVKSEIKPEVESEVNVDTKKEKSKEVDPRKQVLLKLANDRTKLVKKHFVEIHKISPKRLFACNGKIVKDEKDEVALPAVEITL